MTVLIEVLYKYGICKCINKVGNWKCWFDFQWFHALSRQKHILSSTELIFSVIFFLPLNEEMI